MDREEERLIDGNSQTEDSIEFSLRPKILAHFIGQDHIKKPLSISVEAAKKRKEPIEHVLLYGNPGLGKTTLANIIAREMDTSIKVTSGPALDRVGDLAAILSNLAPGDVLFIDEIHRMNRSVEEVLYTAMEDYAIDIIVGKGPAARNLRMAVEPFTLIGATTKLNLLSSPLRDRFGHIYHLRYYNGTDMERIVQRSASLFEIDIHDDAASMISSRSRHTPRIANRLLKRVRDYAQVKANGIITIDAAKEALELLSVDEHGLDEVDRTLLKAIVHTYGGGPVGLSTLAAAIAEDVDTVETVYEPYLLQIGMLERTPRGRKVTPKAVDHLNKNR